MDMLNLIELSPLSMYLIRKFTIRMHCLKKVPDSIGFLRNICVIYIKGCSAQYKLTSTTLMEAANLLETAITFVLGENGNDLNCCSFTDRAVWRMLGFIMFFSHLLVTATY